MIFLPLSTDAPVYYWPYATVGLIVTNVLVFVGMVAGVINPFDGWLLEQGGHLSPKQWLLSMFAHAGFWHLFGNMLFLWVFGLVVEGKLGWWRFLLVYLSVGVTQSAFEQCVYLSSGDLGYSLGASSAIYGIMAIAAIWAPKNEVTMLGWAFVFAGTFDVSIALLAAIYIGLDVLMVVLSSGEMSSSWLHATGVMVGLPVGVVLLRTGVVDCEGWDLFHVWGDDPGGVKEQEAERQRLRQQRERQLEQRSVHRKAMAHQQFTDCLSQGNAATALRLLNNAAEQGEPIEPSAAELKALVARLHKAGRFRESAPWMAELIRVDPASADLVRIKLAQICVAELERPGRAIDLLQQVDSRPLLEQHAKLIAKVRARADQLQAAGVVEIDNESW